jgi:dihydrolipoamide dehydrogenase
MSDNPDLIVVGAGPGGYVAAIRAAQLGLKVALVERSHLGGICLNWGCIPAKALLSTGEVFDLLSHLKQYGVSATTPTFDLNALVKRSRAIAQQLSAGVAFLMKKNKIMVLEGTARLQPGLPAPRVIVRRDGQADRILEGPSVILATGAHPRLFPAIGLAPDGRRIWTYREALIPERVPASLLVVGSGAIGVEFASFYRALGSMVTVVEAVDRILPNEDAEVSSVAQKAYEKRGIQFRTGTTVSAARAGTGGVTLEISRDGDEGVEALDGEVALVAIGVEGNVEGLGLEDLGVKLERGHIITDRHGATNVPGLFAIGDVAGGPWLAHKASHEGVHCVERIAGRADSGLVSPIPGCTYSDPQVASVGLTEEKARELYGEIKIGRFPFRFNGRALSAGITEGFVKTIFDTNTGKLVGAHMVGAEATELIQGFVIAMTLEATEEALAHVMFPHPTLSEVMHESVLSASDLALHM